MEYGITRADKGAKSRRTACTTPEDLKRITPISKNEWYTYFLRDFVVVVGSFGFLMVRREIEITGDGAVTATHSVKSKLSPRMDASHRAVAR